METERDKRRQILFCLIRKFKSRMVPEEIKEPGL